MKLTPIIAKQHYFKPGEANRLGLWKFITYLGSREGSHGWVDRGMGSSREDILRCSDERRSRQVQLRDLVFAPDPHLMKHVPEDRRHRVMERTTDRSMQTWFAENGWGEAEYSRVLHDKEENGRDQVHSHVVMAGTIQPDPLLKRRKHRVDRVHLEDLRRTASKTFIREMERELGKEKVQEILRDRDAAIELERAARSGPAGPNMGQVASVIGLMNQQERDKQLKKRGKEISKKTKQRRAERDLRQIAKQREQAGKLAERDQRRQAREERLTQRERLHQEKLAELRRQEQAKNTPTRGFYPDFFGIDLD